MKLRWSGLTGNRSTGPGLSIWTHNLRGIEFTDSFKPRGCGKCAGQPAVVVGAGEQWGDVYTAIAPRDQYIVGGGDPGVGLGGWTTGGGHSPLSAIYGLGADNVLEIEMVTPMGEIVTANAYQHTDLFWAMRGVRVFSSHITSITQSHWTNNTAGRRRNLRHRTELHLQDAPRLQRDLVHPGVQLHRRRS